jgi:hypothetical protein
VIRPQTARIALPFATSTERRGAVTLDKWRNERLEESALYGVIQ